MNHFRPRFAAAVAVALVSGLTATAHAVTKTWTGATNNNWSVGSNWSPPGAPGNADDVVVSGATTPRLDINTTVDVRSITIQGGYNRNIAPTNASTIRVRTGGILLSDNIVLRLSTTTTQIDGSVSVSAGTVRGNGGATTITGSVNVSGTGTFDGDAGTLAVTTNVVLTGSADFTASSTTNTIGGAVTHNSSGTLATSGGAFSVTGNFSQSAGTTSGLTGSFTVGTIMVPATVSMTGGAFNGAGGVVTINGDLTTSAGSGFRASSTTTTISGNVSHGSSGTLDLNDGNTNVGGSIGQSNGTITGASGTTTVTGNITEAGGTFTAGAGLITVGGNLSVTSGAFNGAAGMIRIAGNLGPLSGGTCRLSSSTTWIGGTFNRTSVSNTFDVNGGTILFRASSSRTHTLNDAALARVVFNDGLAGYWSLEESANPRADSSGYANDGTFNGTYTAAATRPPVAYADTAATAFNGGSNYITLGTTNLPVANAAQSISAWVNFSSAAATQTIVAMTASGSAIKLGLGGGNLRVLRNDGTALVQVAAPSTGAWHHVAYVHDPLLAGAARDKLYVDGTMTTGTNNSHNTATPTAAYLGATSPGVDPYAGSLDEVRIYTRALGAREMTDFAFGRMPATGVVTHTLDSFNTSGGDNDGDIVLASGIVAGTGALTIEGNWLNYGGRFTGSGSVTLNGGGNGRILLSGGYVFSNLTIDSTGRYTLSDRLWVPGTLNLAGQASSLNDGGYAFHAGTFTTAVTNAYQVTTSGTAVIDGRSNQTITAQNFNRLRLEAPNETGLAGYWKLDEGQESTARDVSGSGNTGTLSAAGASWVAASTTIGFDNATAASFNGTSGYIQAGATGLPAAGAAQTVSAWVKFSSAAATQTLVAMTAGGSAINLGLGGGNLRVRRSDGTVLAQVAAPSAGSWHHVAYVYDPTASGVNRDKIYVDGTATTGTNTSHDGSAPTATFLGATSASADFLNGQLDDVRVYTQALTPAQVASLNLGRYAGTGISTTLTLGHNVNVAAAGAGVAIDSGVLYSSTFNMTVSVAGVPCRVDSGTLRIGTGIVNCDGGLTVNPMGTLLMNQAGGQFQPGVNSVVAIDGTLTASATGAIIQRDNGGERFSFRVGTFAGSTPTLNITGLTVRDTDIDGMRINYNTGAATTITRFDNVAFLRGVAGAGAQFLQIYSPFLHLSSQGCTFGIGQNAGVLPQFAVKLMGDGTANGETRAIFGGATCAGSKTDATSGLCVADWKSDDDANLDGVPTTPGTNGATVVQFVRGVGTDVAGTVEGFPTAAFDWNTFAYYSTYVAFHDVSGTVDRVYVRTQTGGPEYSWDTPSGEEIVGTPRWVTSGTTHYLYVATASGKVYRLIDNGVSLTQDNSGNWAGAANPFNCACTILTPLVMNATNLYWGGTQPGPVQMVWTLGQDSRAQPMGSPFTITPVITSASPSLWESASTSFLFMGLTGNLIKLNVSNQTLEATNTNPGSASIRGRVTAFGSRVFAGDDGGNVWAIATDNFAGTAKIWQHTISGDSIMGTLTYDTVGQVVHVGTEAGKMAAINSSGLTVTGYPIPPEAVSDSIRAAPFYLNGILIFGTTTGKLYFYDRNNGSAPALIRKVSFGPTQSISGVGYDSNALRYMVSTADPVTKDGRLYFFDAITDPSVPK